MTECEIYMTLAMRNIYDNDRTKLLSVKDMVKHFAETYEERKITKSWVFHGHPVTLSFCHFECRKCWGHWMEEFINNKQDHCDL